MQSCLRVLCVIDHPVNMTSDCIMYVRLFPFSQILYRRFQAWSESGCFVTIKCNVGGSISVPQVLVARMVSAAMGRAVSAADAEEKWRGEVQLLRNRIHRMGRMEEAIEQARERADMAARHTLKRRVLHGTLATCCGAVGIAGAIVFISKVRAHE